MPGQEATAFHTLGDQSICSKRINTPPFPPDCWRIAGGGPGPQKPVNLTGGWALFQSLQKLRKSIGHFEKAPGLSQTQAPGYIPRGTKNSLLAHHTTPLASLPLPLSLSPSLAYDPHLHSAHTCSLHGHMALATMQPVTSMREPEYQTQHGLQLKTC